MFKNIHLVVNPAAGQDQPFLGMVNKIFREAGVDWDLHITKEAGDAQRLAKESVSKGADLVVAYGGDGTVMEVASGLVHSGVPLGIFAGGTANVMSVELGVPGELEQACRLLVSPDSALQPLDVGQIGPEGDRYFLLRIGMGFEADLVNGAAREQKDRFGTMAYVLSALQAATNPTVSSYHIVLDGSVIETEGITCMITNVGGFGAQGVTLNPRIDMCDGLFDVMVVRAGNLRTLATVALNVLLKREQSELVQHWQAREISVVSDPPQLLQVDGEILGNVSVYTKVLPGAVQVVVPTLVTPPSSQESA